MMNVHISTRLVCILVAPVAYKGFLRLKCEGYSFVAIYMVMKTHIPARFDCILGEVVAYCVSAFGVL